MAAYQQFVSSRTNEPDPGSLISQLRALDNTAGVIHFSGNQNYTIKKNTAWTTQQINAAQIIIDNAPALSPQLAAQTLIDQLSLAEKAVILTILDQFNLIRSKLVPVLPPITVDQMIAAIRTKAGTL